MHNRLFVILAFFTSASLFVAGCLKADEPQSAPPDLRLDRTPIERQVEGGNPTSYADVLDEVRPAVVTVFSTRVVEQRMRELDPFFRRFFGLPEEEGEPRRRRQHGLGSGVVVTSDGYILTNNHVIEDAEEVRVLLSDRREFEAEVIGTDPKTDVAVLKIDAAELPVVTLADSDNIRVGDIVFALGNPLNVGQTVTMGIVSATGRTRLGVLGEDAYENFIQIDAAINQGNSGGPLVDARGRVIGINTAILVARTGGNIGIGFAIPINMASHVMQSLVTTGTVARGFLGVNIQDLTPDLAEEFGLEQRRGALVSDVVPDRPAAEAGLERGDVIVGVNDIEIDSASALRLTISQIAPGTEVRIAYVRNGERRQTDVTLGDLDQLADGIGPVGDDELLEGIRVSEMTGELRNDFDLDEDVEGVIVVETDSGSRYAEHFPGGTLITAVNRRAIRTLAEAHEALREGRNVFLIQHRGVFRYLAVTID